ncbi:MAG: hypothetical protein LBM70_09970 [Victivallales bacterium]|jgi:hypothetical protein|nr:hypothetical protein [Victivallales bacterium]
MKFCRLLLLFFFCLTATAAPLQEDRELESQLLNLKLRAAGTQAEFMGNRVSAAYVQLMRSTLLEKRHGDPVVIRQKLLKLRDEIRLGLDWPKPKQYVIPYVDGGWSAKNQTNTLTFEGEYPVNSQKIGDTRTVWKFCYDRKHLYWSARFYDPTPRSVPEKPYEGDALELFVRGDPRLREYRELVVDCAGNTHTAWNVTKLYGTYDNYIGPCDGFKFRVLPAPDGWIVEASVPWGEIPGYLPGAEASQGATVVLMALRTRYGGKTAATPIPFPYDGHNIYGHMTMTLGKESK